MKIKGDFHTHTIASPGAFSTLIENVEIAKKKGFEFLVTSDHGPAMKKGGASYMHFQTLRMVPSEIGGIQVIRGIEANILDKSGSIDVPKEFFDRIDFIIAGFHSFAWEGGTKKENTDTLKKVIENPKVNMIAHLENPEFPVDLEEILSYIKKRKNFLVEINNSSLSGTREGSEENCLFIAERCKEMGLKVALTSDAHIATSVGVFDKVFKVLEKVNFPEGLIINKSKEETFSFLGLKEG